MIKIRELEKLISMNEINNIVVIIARDAWPLGNEYLSGPPVAIMSSWLADGRLRLNIDLTSAIIKISRIRPFKEEEE